MTTLFYRLGMISKALKIGIVISILIVLGAIFI